MARRETHRPARTAPTTRPRHTDVRPNPRLGQNFLIDPSARRLMLRTVGTTPPLVYEVGAGTGALTRPLALANGKVVAYEIDPRLINPLQASVQDLNNVTCVRGDFLRARPPRVPFAVVGNIPYNRSTDIVRWCLHARHLSGATLLTQLEFAHKHTGRNGKWSQLCVLAWPRFELNSRGRVGRRSFHPAPQVDAGILCMRRRDHALVNPGDMHAFEDFVRFGFTGKGGSLEATLAREYPRRCVLRALDTAGVPRKSVVGFVSPDQWISVFHGLRSPV